MVKLLCYQCLIFWLMNIYKQLSTKATPRERELVHTPFLVCLVSPKMSWKALSEAEGIPLPANLWTPTSSSFLSLLSSSSAYNTCTLQHVYILWQGSTNIYMWICKVTVLWAIWHYGLVIKPSCISSHRLFTHTNINTWHVTFLSTY